jgi:hypothetical protein
VSSSSGGGEPASRISRPARAFDALLSGNHPDRMMNAGATAATIKIPDN